MTYPALADLTVVNRRINDDDAYVSDPAQYGMPDLWADIRVTQKGDCEDYGIGKLRELLDLGWPIEALRLAICTVEEFRKEDGQWATVAERCHGVLLATAQDGQDWCLDNRQPDPLKVQDTGYIFDFVQPAGKPYMEPVRK